MAAQDEMKQELVEEALGELRHVQERIAETLLEIDFILLQENPRIEAEYAVKIGGYRFQLLQAELDARRAKRKLAIARARVNNGEHVEDSELEVQLAAELADWEGRVQQAMHEYADALDRKRGSRFLSPRESAEAKQLHRTLIKRLHPDLHPSQTLEEKRLFLVAQSAFEHGDLESLRSVESATAHLDKNERSFSEPDEIWAEVELAQAELNLVMKRLEEVRSTYPYTLKELLSDPEWVRKTVESYKRDTEKQNEVAKEYRRRYEQLMGGNEA